MPHFPQARKYLGRFGLHGDLALQPVKFLSGGQKSRLAFAELAWWGGPRPEEVEGPKFIKIQGAVQKHVYQFNDVPWHSGFARNPDVATDDKELTSHHASG